MLENFKEALDRVTSVSTIFMNLSKAFDILNHDLLIAKLEAYGFSAKSLSCIHSYLNKRLQKTIVNCDFSLRKEIFSGVPQGSILGPLLFNVYINDIFFFVDVVFLSNYADDTALYSAQKTHILNQSVLKKNFMYLQKWFHDNLQFIFTGQFSFCPLIWTFCSRQSNHLINKLQKRALRVTYNDSDSSFSELLEICYESTIHIKNIKALMTEIYKFLNDLSPPVMNDIFQKQKKIITL